MADIAMIGAAMNKSLDWYSSTARAGTKDQIVSYCREILQADALVVETPSQDGSRRVVNIIVDVPMREFVERNLSKTLHKTLGEFIPAGVWFKVETVENLIRRADAPRGIILRDTHVMVFLLLFCVAMFAVLGIAIGLGLRGFE